MANFTKPVQVLFSSEQYRCLWKIAKEQQKSLASIVRDAVEQVYGITSSRDYVIIESIGKRQLRDYQFYGMWKDKTDMADGAEWVRKQRENWNERLKRNQVDFAIAFTVLIAMMFYYRTIPKVTLLWFPAFMLMAIATSLGVGLMRKLMPYISNFRKKSIISYGKL